MARARTQAVMAPTVEAWIALAEVALARLAARHAAPSENGAKALASGEASGPDGDEKSNQAATLDPALATARERFASSLATGSAFATLVANAQIDVADAEVLAVATAIERDRHLQRIIAYVQDDPASRRLELGSLATLFTPDHPGLRAVGPDAPLRRAALIDVVEDGPWARHAVVVQPSVLWALVGDASRDPDLPVGTTTVSIPDVAADGVDLVVVCGPDRVRRRAAAASATFGSRFLIAPAPQTETAWSALVREATIVGAGIVVELDEDLPVLGKRWVERAQHLPWALSSAVELPLRSLPDRPRVEIVADDDRATDEEWRAAFGDDEPRRHHLSAEQVELVAGAFHARGRDFDDAVRRLASGRLEHLARRTRPTRRWDDIVLTPDRRALLLELTNRYRHSERVYDEWGFRAVPSRGMVALFSGPSGTGKTLAAEIIAGDLGLDMFKLDLSAVVSKYIGETEKNLEEVFEAAAAGNVVLFFDEADALFGKRSEVKDARDRYANIEVSYLLQRLEVYNGLVVLATNYERNIDEAFLRRIHTRVEFAMPTALERAAIWRTNLPPGAPVGDVDMEFLAERFEMTGGAIRNVALRAAFATAAAGADAITMEALVDAVAREYQKLGRLVRPEFFRPYRLEIAEPPD